MMVLVEKLRFYSGNVLDFLEKGIEILIATYSALKRIQIVILLIYLITHGLLSINLFEFMLWCLYLEHH